MPNQPPYNFSEGVLQKLALFATKKIGRTEMINWLRDNGTDDPEQFLKERERLLSAIGGVIENYKKGEEAGSDLDRLMDQL
jgi:hypothetical protein